MTSKNVDLDNWPRAGQFRFYKTFDKPHYAITSRMQIDHVIARKAEGISAYRACLYAIGAGIHAVPELCMRFQGDQVVRHDVITLSMTVPNTKGSFNYAYVPYVADFETFDRQANEYITRASQGAGLGANLGPRDDMAYLSCLPWLDFTSFNNAMRGPDDCIPRVSWGKFVERDGHWDMAMTIEVHHALVDGAQVGAYFTAVQGALNTV